MQPAVSPGVAIAVAALLALGAARLGTLTRPGALAAGVIGTAILVGGGWHGGLVLITFFVTSNAIPTLLRSSDNEAAQSDGPRRARQVLANGGAGALGALVGLWSPTAGLWLITGGLASATADTWATEVGTRLGGTPRNLVTGREVQTGTSGGVTLAGTVAGLSGAGTIAAVASLGTGDVAMPLVLGGTVAGTLGMLMDSLVGATWQASYRCRDCATACEAPVHHCGAGTELVRGVRWLDNDLVNACSTTLAAGASWLFCWLAGFC